MVCITKGFFSFTIFKRFTRNRLFVFFDGYIVFVLGKRVKSKQSFKMTYF